MVEITAVAAALNSVKMTRELIQVALGARDEAMLKAKLREIEKELGETGRLVLEAHATALTLLHRNHELERQVAQHEAWAAEAARYEMMEFEPGRIAYRIKESARSVEPVHYACPTCFQKHEKSIMQAESIYGSVHIKCPVCKLSVRTNQTEPFSF